VPVATTSYVYGGCIDVFILLDRIAVFNRTVKRYLKFNAYEVCFVLLIFSIAMEIPDDMGNMPSSVTVQLNSTENFTVWFLNNTPFAASKLGKTMLITIYIMRDFGGLMAQIILNLVSIYFLKAHFKKKINLMRRNTRVLSTVATTFAQGNQARRMSNVASDERISSMESKATLMVIIMCILSAVEHLLVLISYIYPLIDVGLTTFILYAISDFFWVLRRVFDFVLFFIFNSNFRKVCLSRFKISTTESYFFINFNLVTYSN
jgi:hypothetical protein